MLGAVGSISSDAFMGDVLYGAGADCFEWLIHFPFIISIFVVLVLMPFDV